MDDAARPGRLPPLLLQPLVENDRIRAVELYAKNSRVAILEDGTRVPVSREGHARLSELLEEAGEA